MPYFFQANPSPQNSSWLAAANPDPDESIFETQMESIDQEVNEQQLIRIAFDDRKRKKSIEELWH